VSRRGFGWPPPAQKSTAMIIYKFLLLISLVRVLIATDKPWLCSGIYAGAVFLLGLVFGHPFLSVLIHTSISLVLTCIYFWLLDRLDGSEVLWWLIQQTLTHTSYYKILTPDPILPDEPVFLRSCCQPTGL
jgi:hypothetical protein